MLQALMWPLCSAVVGAIAGPMASKVKHHTEQPVLPKSTLSLVGLMWSRDALLLRPLHW